MEQAVIALQADVAQWKATVQDEFKKQTQAIENQSLQYSASLQQIERESTKFAGMVATGEAEFATKVVGFEGQVKSAMETLGLRAEEQKKESEGLDKLIKEGFARFEQVAKEGDEARLQQAAATAAAFARFDSQCTLKLSELSGTMEQNRVHTEAQVREIVTRITQGAPGAQPHATPSFQQTFVPRARREEESAGFDMSRGDKKSMGLCSRKDLEVWRLPDEVTKPKFVHWRDQLLEYLENSSGWRGATQIFEEIRKAKTEVNSAWVQGLDTEEGTDLDQHHCTLTTTDEKSEELYALLATKSNTTVNGLRKEVTGRNGFEYYRQIIK